MYVKSHVLCVLEYAVIFSHDVLPLYTKPELKT